MVDLLHCYAYWKCFKHPVSYTFLSYEFEQSLLQLNIVFVGQEKMFTFKMTLGKMYQKMIKLIFVMRFLFCFRFLFMMEEFTSSLSLLPLGNYQFTQLVPPQFSKLFN